LSNEILQGVPLQLHPLWNRQDFKSAKIIAKKNQKENLCVFFASLRLCVFKAIAFSDNVQETATG